LRDIADAVELGADLVLIVLREIGCEIDPSHLSDLDILKGSSKTYEFVTGPSMGCLSYGRNKVSSNGVGAIVKAVGRGRAEL
jgi:hypothetical protein